MRAVNIRELLDRMAENLSVRRSFGAAYERDGLFVVPVAYVAGGGGGGEGPIKPPAAERTAPIETAKQANVAPPDGQPPTSTGGGFGGLVLPSGVYIKLKVTRSVGPGIRHHPDRPCESQRRASVGQPAEERQTAPPCLTAASGPTFGEQLVSE